MKTLLSLTLLFSLLFVGCEKDPDGPFVPTPDNSTTINFEIGYLTSDKPAAEISATKDFEDAITMMKVWVFQGVNDAAVLCRDFTSAEITAMKAVLTVPKILQGEKLTVMTVANLGGIKTTSKKSLLVITDEDPSRYNNNSYSDMTTKSVKIDGFTMFSRDEIVIGSETSYTLKNKLEKNVAKIEIIMDNKFMREENEHKAEGYEGFFKAEYLTLKANDCSTQLFGKSTERLLHNITAAAIQPSEFISQGIGYFCYKQSNSFSFDVDLDGVKKSPGSLTTGKYGYRVMHNGSIVPNKHYIITCRITGGNYHNVSVVSFEEKDWVKANYKTK